MSNAIEYKVSTIQLKNRKGKVINAELKEIVSIKFPDGVWNIIKEYLLVDIKFYVNRYTLSTKDLLQYVVDEDSPKKLIKFSKTLDDDDETFIECYSIGLFNKSPVQYDELWLVDIDDDYAPSLNININTSSGYAGWKCCLSEYNEEENEDNNKMTLQEICELVNPTYKKWVKKTLLEYKKKEHNNSY